MTSKKTYIVARTFPPHREGSEIELMAREAKYMLATGEIMLKSEFDKRQKAAAADEQSAAKKKARA